MNLLLKLARLLDRNQVKRLTLLQILVIITSVFESVSVVAIAPLMTAITDAKNLEHNFAYIYFNNHFHVHGAKDFVLYYSLFFLIVLFFANLLSVVTIWLLSVFAAQFGGKLSDKLYRLYLSMNYSRFLSLGSAYITKQISSEVSRLTDNILQPVVQINARIFSGLLICTMLFLYNPFAAALSIVIFSLAYFVIYFFIKKKLKTHGTNLSTINQKRFRYISEGFGAFKEIKSFGVSNIFINRFSRSSDDFANAYSTLNTIYNAPRYIIEFFVFSTLVFLIFKYNSVDSNVELISVISVFGLAALKLLPIFQQIYSCLAQIRGHKNALDLIYRDIVNETYSSDLEIENSNESSVSNNQQTQVILLKLENISFFYDERQDVLAGINIEFKQGSSSAIVGKSGAGKTTLLDIVTGLILPKKGKLIFKDESIDSNNLNLLRSSISVVPQSPFIIEGTFAENVAFSFGENIDLNKIRLVLVQADLLDFIESLPNGINTMIGDGFVLLSGGQKQRLAIARALYRESEIIFFDEPTSSLDPESENAIVKLIYSLAPQKTIITISHKLSTIKDYDNIIIIDEGRVKQHGDYNFLMENSDLFKKIMYAEK